MQDERKFKESFEEKFPTEKKIETSEEVEQKPEREEEKIVEKSEEKERIVPTVEVLKTATTTPLAIQKRNLTDEEEEKINSLVNLTIKNPNIEKGLEEANKVLNSEVQRFKKQGKEYAYLIDEFHDRLVLEFQKRARKFKS